MVELSWRSGLRLGRTEAELMPDQRWSEGLEDAGFRLQASGFTGFVRRMQSLTGLLPVLRHNVSVIIDATASSQGSISKLIWCPGAVETGANDPGMELEDLWQPSLRLLREWMRCVCVCVCNIDNNA